MSSSLSDTWKLLFLSFEAQRALVRMKLWSLEGDDLSMTNVRAAGSYSMLFWHNLKETRKSFWDSEMDRRECKVQTGI